MDTCRMHDKTENTSQDAIVLFLFCSKTIEYNNIYPLSLVKVFCYKQLLQNFHLSVK